MNLMSYMTDFRQSGIYFLNFCVRKGTNMEQPYQEDLYNTITINLFLMDDGGYEIRCPQWRYVGYSKTPEVDVKELVEEIVNHNKQEVCNG